MALSIGHVVFDCENPQKLSAFWSDVLDRPVDDGGSEFFVSIDDSASDRPSIYFIQVPEHKTVKNRMHLDLNTTDRESDIKKLVSMGAERVADHDEWGAVWTVMRDPEGNEFCVAQH